MVRTPKKERKGKGPGKGKKSPIVNKETSEIIVYQPGTFEYPLELDSEDQEDDATEE